MKIALALMALVLLVGGAWFYQAQSHFLRRGSYDDLAAIAQLKVDQIAQWRAERLGDAAVLMESPFLAEAVARFMKDPQSGDTEKMLARFRSLQKNYHYDAVLLMDAGGKVRLSLSGHLAPLHEMAKQALTAAFRERRPVMTDLYVFPGEYDAHLDVVAPVFVENSDSGAPIGAILLHCEAKQFLYPLIQSWPLPSRTAETLLVRRDGEAVLFLSELRHQKGTAFRLRIPLSRKDAPAVMAVLGQQGVVAGKDYRGIEVLSALKAVPDTPWFMVAKMDTSEALSVMRRESVFILALFFGLFVIGAAAMGMVWQRNEKALYRSLLETETARRKSEERYRITLMSVGDGVITSDVSGRVEQLNPVAEALTGWQQAEAFGKPVEEVFRIINEETRRPVKNPVNRVLREGIVAGLANHTVLIARDGSEHPIADSGAPIRDEKGAISGVVLVFRDQTAERETERTLRESEERFRLLIEQAPEAIVVFDVEEDRFVEANVKAEKLFGCRREELLRVGPQHFYSPIQPDGLPIAESMKENIERSLAGEEMLIERALHNAAGRDLICEVRLVRLPSAERRLIRNSYIDITERKEMEKELKESEQRFRTIFDNAVDGMLLADPESKKFFLGNKAICQMLGYSQEEIKNLGVMDIHPEEDLPFVIGQFESQKNQEITLAKDILLRRKDGSVFYTDINSAIVTLTKKEYLMGIFRDITERKRVEDQVRVSLKEKEVLLKEIHHRVKNNLAVVQSLLNLQAGKIKDPQAQEAFKESRDRIRSMALVHEKLYQSPDLAHIDMADYLRDLSTRLFYSSQVSPDKVKLKLEMEGVQIGINTAVPMGLILNELISNALKHAFPGGREGKIRVGLARVDGGMIRLTVENNGIGFPEEVDFRKAKSMGFQVVTALVEQLGGTIEMKRDKGTVFTITFRG
jgi:PAS domain S-box-containing protein